MRSSALELGRRFVQQARQQFVRARVFVLGQSLVECGEAIRVSRRGVWKQERRRVRHADAQMGSAPGAIAQLARKCCFIRPQLKHVSVTVTVFV